MKNIKLIILVVVFAAALANQYFFMEEVESVRHNNETRKNVVMPPSLSLITVALGPVRGLIVDALWWKVSELKEEGDYFEILRITDWITVMQPHNSFVWTYHSWNLAYNIANEFPTPETRWKWIYSGVKLLRDEGLKINPGNQFLESELGWLFCDRIGGFTDPAQSYFIKEWAGIMSKYLITGRRKDLEQLASPSTPSDKKRAYEIKAKLGLLPERMLAIDKEYGPFQWKLTQAQAVYWGARKNSLNYRQGDLNYKSTVISAMQMSFLYGSLFEDKKAGLFITSNNFAITGNIIRYYKKQIKESKHSVREINLFSHFITNAAPILYAFDHKDLALDLFKEFKKMHPDIEVEFKSFIDNNLNKMNRNARGRYHQSLVEISLFHGYIYLAHGEFKKAAEFAEKAEKRWSNHQKEFAGNPVRKLPPINNLKIAAFVKILKKFPESQQRKLLDLVHNKMAAKLQIDSKVSFNAYLKK
jgi:hypothetical protein